MSSTDLDQRYGRRRPRLTHNQHYAVITLAVLLGVVAMYFVFLNSEPAVQGTIDDYQITGPRQVIVMYEVQKKASIAATCVVRARNAAGAQVGAHTVSIPAGKTVTRQTYALATTDQPIDGEIEDCAVAP